MAVDGHGGFHHRLAECRVRMDVATELPSIALEQLSKRGLGDELGGARPDDVRAEQAAGLGVRDHLCEAAGFAVDDRAPERCEGKLADLDLVAFLDRLL